MKKIKSLLLLAILIANIVFLFLLKALFFISSSSLLRFKSFSNSEKLNIYLFWLIDNLNILFALWIILFILTNGILIVFSLKKLNKTNEAIISIGIALVILILAETILRISGYHPGIHTKVYYFNPVDSLYLLEGSITDSNGILKINENARETIRENIQNKNAIWDNTKYIDAYSLASENIKIIEGKTDNELSRLYNRLINKSPLELSELDKAIIEFIQCPINEDGFRSIAFKQYELNKTKVLLLGDSFTWGHSTTIKTNSFADILLSKGYVVYNTGISATDVAQYLAVANKYIPELKPDFVIVNFYLGNDITYFKREVLPFKPMLYPTNAGVLMASPHGKYFDNEQSAYDLTLKHWRIPERDNYFNLLMSKLSFTTLIWKILLKFPYGDRGNKIIIAPPSWEFFIKSNVVNYGTSEIAQYYINAEKRKFRYPYCNDELRKIKEIAEAHGAKFILSSIPEVYRFVHRTKEDFPDLFDNTLPYHEMIVNKTNYVLANGHFNDIGHSKYADFLDSVIITKQHK